METRAAQGDWATMTVGIVVISTAPAQTPQDKATLPLLTWNVHRTLKSWVPAFPMP